MILDYLENYEKYEKMLPNLRKGMELVRSVEDSPVGSYDGEDGIYAMVQEGVTADISGNKFETHKKYLDVQIVMEGCECIQWENASRLDISDEYNPDADLKLYRGNGKNITISEGMFYILFPEDAHKCCGKADAQGGHYRKIVLKLPVQ